MAVDQAEFKRVLRSWVSGVTIVTARSGDTIHGMTVSAFSSVSADPPLVLICASRSSQTNSVIRQGGVFSVNILGDEQAEISAVFARTGAEESRFDHVTWHAGSNGAPIIDDAIASLECHVNHAHDEGSHTIYVGFVDQVHAGKGAPLVYYSGDYRKLSLT